MPTPEQRFQHFKQEHPDATTAGELATGAVGVKAYRITRAAHGAHVMADAERASKLADDLKHHSGVRMPDMPADPRDLLRGVGDQIKVNREATKHNKDLRAVSPAFNKYSRTLKAAKDIREASNAPEHKQVRGVRAVAHPFKYEDQKHADALSRVIRAAKPGDHPELHRVMRMPHQHKVGDVIDFGNLSSWTENHRIGHQVAGIVHDPANPHTNHYVMHPGDGHAANLAPASKQFLQQEWLARGKYQVHHIDDQGRYHVRKLPDETPSSHVEKSAFGVVHKASDASLRRHKKIQSALYLTGSTVGLAALGSKGRAVQLKRVGHAAEKAAKWDTRATNAAVTGSGVGGVSGFNQAYIYNQESKKTVVHKGVRRIVRNIQDATEAGKKAANDSAEATEKVKRLIPSRKVAAAGYGATVATTAGALYGGSYEGSKKGAQAGIAKKHRDPLLQEYGLRGAPQGVDREKRQQIWEARAKHLNTKRDRWHRTSQGARGVETTANVTAGATGAVIAGAQLRDKYREGPGNEKKLLDAGTKAYTRLKPVVGAKTANKVVRAAVHGKPGFKTMATVAGASAVGAAAHKGRVIADKKTRKYSSASGGIAAGTARRMKDYNQSAFGVHY